MNRKYFLFIIIIIFSVQIIYPKGNDGKGNDNKGNVDKGKRYGNQLEDQDKGNKLRQERKSDMDKDESKVNNKNKIQIQDRLSERIRNCIKITEDSQKLSKEISKNITKDDSVNMSENYKLMKGNINKMNEEKKYLLDSLDEEQKKEINDQLNIIEESQKNINYKIEQFDTELDKDKKNKDKILRMNNELEKEINKTERQFRAIEWLLSEE